MTEQVAHTPGAIRAGRNISERFRRALPNLPESNAETLAAIIDAETAAPELLRALQHIVLFERKDEDFLAGLAEDSAARDENPSTPVWRERLLEAAERAISKAAAISSKD